MVFNAEGNLFHKTLQIVLQLNRHIVRVKWSSFVRIPKNGRDAIVSRDDDKTVRCIENVKSGIATSNVVRSHQLQFIHTSQWHVNIGIHKFHRHLASGTHINGGCLHSQGEVEQKHDK